MPYQYQSYPKWIDTAEGRKLVHSEAEHSAEMAAKSGRDALIEQAEAIGIKVDGRWSDARIAKEIESAK